MAGKRNPWGTSSGGGNGNDGSSGGDEPAGEGGAQDSAGGGSEDGDQPNGPRNPWLPGGGTPANPGGADKPRRSNNIEDLFKNRGPEGPRRGSGGPRGPNGPNFRMPQTPGGKSFLPLVIGGILVIGLGSTMIHQIAPTEQAIVTTLGSYSRTLQPGLNFTAPAPIQSVKVTNVTSIRSVKIPDGKAEKLILTGDQNLVDLSYLIRWSIKDLKQYEFQLAEPDETVQEVAEAAMRASVAEQKLDAVLSGAGRATIEQRVHSRMQAILDAYRSGIQVQGVEIDKTDPPERVVEAFKDVSAAQQDADAERNRAEAYAQQILARAQGDAASFDKIYAEYRLAPEVTRRRLYYETMESVLSKTDKTILETNGVAPYLPLPAATRAATAPAAPAATAAPKQGQ